MISTSRPDRSEKAVEVLIPLSDSATTSTSRFDRSEKTVADISTSSSRKYK